MKPSRFYLESEIKSYEQQYQKDDHIIFKHNKLGGRLCNLIKLIKSSKYVDGEHWPGQ